MYLRFLNNIQSFLGDLVGPIFVGVMCGWVSFGVIFLSVDGFDLDYNLVTNIVIACATVTAVLVHMNALNTQERSRRWDLRKSIIFELLQNLSEVTELNEEIYDLGIRLTRVSSDEEAREIPEWKRRYAEVDPKWRKAKERMVKHLDNLQNVYRPILPNEMIESISQFESNMQELSRRSKQEWAEFEDLVADEGDILLTMRSQVFDFVEKESGLN